MQSKARGLAFFFMLGLLGLLFLIPVKAVEPIQVKTYSQLVVDVQAGAVQQVSLGPAEVTAQYQDGKVWRVSVPEKSTKLLNMFIAQGVQVNYAGTAPPSAWSLFFSALIPMAVLIGVIWFITRQNADGAGQASSFGESRARLHAPDKKPITMRDVAGMPEVKEELTEVVDFLRNPERYLALGARIPKGVLLSGPPGTGKTLLARAVAGEAGVAFFSIAGSDFVEMFAGVGASRVRDLFGKAKQNAPCIIFVDEIDAVGRQRGASLGGGNDEREQTLNQLLVEMDGFSVNEGVIVMAATNRPDVLDQALLRAGRFDRQITVDPPDRQGRREILAVHAAGKPLADDVDLDQLAMVTTGFTGADLANLMNEAALLAARHCKRAVDMTEMTAAFERVVTGGPALKGRLAKEDRTRVAFHEAGHAVVSRKLRGTDSIVKVTIIPRGRALGYVMYGAREDQNLYDSSEMRDRISELLGGRAAEEVLLGEVSTGASDDLDRATNLARRMVTELGMSHEIGPVRVKADPGSLLGPGRGKGVSERTIAAVDEAVRKILVDGYERALDLVRKHQPALERLAHALLEHESVDGSEIDRILAH